MNRTSVVICAYTLGRWDQLQAAVRSVLVQQPDELVVVVDHCPELEERARSRFATHGVQVLANAEAPGLSGGRNTGSRHSTGDVVLFLDDDAQACAGWLSRHARHYDDPRVLGVGGRVEAQWEGPRPDWFPAEFGWVVGCSYRGQPTTVARVRNPIGANMSFRRSAVQAVGGFSASLGRVGAAGDGCEETELSIRLQQCWTTGRIVYDPDAVVVHHVPSHRATWSYFTRRCWAEGRSKARMTRLVDATAALAPERSYVSKTLVGGIGTNLGRARRERDLTYVARAAAMVTGLTITSAGFAGQRIRAR